MAIKNAEAKAITRIALAFLAPLELYIYIYIYVFIYIYNYICFPHKKNMDRISKTDNSKTLHGKRNELVCFCQICRVFRIFSMARTRLCMQHQPSLKVCAEAQHKTPHNHLCGHTFVCATLNPHPSFHGIFIHPT